MRQVYNEEDWQCPECGGMLRINIDVGDGHFYDVCGGVSGCGFKRKKNSDGQLINDLGEVVQEDGEA